MLLDVDNMEYAKPFPDNLPREAHRVCFLGALRSTLERLGWALGVAHNDVLPHAFGLASFISLACCRVRSGGSIVLQRKFLVCP